MTKDRTSQLTRALQFAATELLAPVTPPERLPSAVAAAVAVFEWRLIRDFGGERLEVPRTRTVSLVAVRKQRICDALRCGEPAEAVAQREGVSPQWVRRVWQASRRRP